MNVWIITTGSSDVQLQNKDRWNTLYPKVRKELEISQQFSFSETEQNGKKLWRYPARAMGVVYGKFLTEHYADLEFPLLNSFSSYLNNKDNKIELNRIIVLLTDQSDVVSVAERNKPSHFYWQDTCTLQPILQHYLKITFPDVVMDKERDFRVLKPEKGSPGLDDWDSVLTLVQKEFIKLGIPEDATVYVSHQAGTPAISSAVQFVSLGKFSTKVQFLVSNEYEKKALEPIKSSKYLKAIKFEQAKELLKNHDYAAVKSLLKDYLDSQTQILLEAAIQWNYAKFDEFAKKLQTLSDEKLVEQVNERTKEENWWWTAYEAAYLATIRLEQGNTVEAFFHAFRAVEGAFLEWGKHEFKSHIEINNDRAYLQPSILCDSKHYFKDAKINPDKPEKNNSLGNLKLKFQELDNRLNNQEKDKQKPKGELLYGTTLYRLFETQKPDYKNMHEYKRFSAQDGISDKRNKNFHQLQGLTEQDCYRDWEVNNLEEWEERILKYLNFIAQPDLPEPLFTSLEDASLMAKVHQKLEAAINSY